MTYAELLQAIRDYTEVDSNVLTDSICNGFIRDAEWRIARDVDADYDRQYSNATLVAGEIAWIFCDGAGAGAAVTKQTISSSPATFTVGTDLTVTGDASVGDDLSLASDGAILNFGADSDVNITHVHDTGLLINAARELRFRDSDLKILSSADGQLDIDADTELELTAPTLQMNVTTADVNGNLDVSGTSTLTGNVTLGGQLIMPDVTDAKILVGWYKLSRSSCQW